MSDANPSHVTGDASDPYVVAKALTLLGEGVNQVDHNLFALSVLLGLIAGRTSPSAQAKARDSLAFIRGAFPDAMVLRAFEEGMKIAPLLPPEGGPGDGIAEKVVRLVSKAA